jgi:hypothetical protein
MRRLRSMVGGLSRRVGKGFARVGLLGKASGCLLGSRDKGGGVDAGWALVVVLCGDRAGQAQSPRLRTTPHLVPTFNERNSLKKPTLEK